MILRPAARKALKDYYFVELYTDKDRHNQEIKDKRFKTSALPWYVLLDSQGNEIASMGGLLTMDGFLSFLKKGLPEPASTKHLVHDDLATAEAESKKTGKPLFIEFTGTN